MKILNFEYILHNLAKSQNLLLWKRNIPKIKFEKKFKDRHLPAQSLTFKNSYPITNLER